MTDSDMAQEALARSVELSAQLRSLREKQIALAAERRDCWMRAAAGGVSLVAVREQCGVSQALVTKELRKVRESATSSS